MHPLKQNILNVMSGVDLFPIISKANIKAAFKHETGPVKILVFMYD